ncbi:MAG: pyridoxal phosphate-dependent aminotransferase [bacterium]
MTRSALLSHIFPRLHKADRPPALVNAVGYLLFSAMRFDPANPCWPGGDVLIYSERYTDAVRDAYLAAGCAPDSIPPAGMARVDERLRGWAYPRRLYALLDASGAGFTARLRKQVDHRITVLCSEPPVDAHEWAVVSTPDLRIEQLDTLLGRDRISHDKPLWLVAPIAGTRLFEPQPASLPPVAQRMAVLGTETAFDVLAQVQRLRAEGRDIISFGLGEPDFDTPEHIKTAAKRALDENQTHYGPSAGLPELREAIAQYIQRTRRMSCDPDEIVVTPGAKPILFDTMMTLLNPGDEALYPNPGYPIYESMIDWVGGVSVPLPLREEKNWNFSIDDLVHRITPRTKLIILNTPGNPTGTLLGKSELREIARLAQEHNLWILADEVYSQIVFNGEFVSIASLPGMKERVIIVDGFSKTYAMTGWRLGYGVMNKTLAHHVAKIETNIDSCACTFTQIAALHALRGPQDESRRMVEEFQARSRVIVEGLNQIEGVRCLPAQGAFYVFANVTGACRRLGLATANDLQRALLEQAGVAVLPRTCFGRKNEGEDQEYIRLSFATSLENIREGLRRMKQFIER